VTVIFFSSAFYFGINTRSDHQVERFDASQLAMPGILVAKDVPPASSMLRIGKAWARLTHHMNTCTSRSISGGITSGLSLSYSWLLGRMESSTQIHRISIPGRPSTVQCIAALLCPYNIGHGRFVFQANQV